MKSAAIILIMTAACAITFNEIASASQVRMNRMPNSIQQMSSEEHSHERSDGNRYHPHREYAGYGASTGDTGQNSNAKASSDWTPNAEEHFGTDSWERRSGGDGEISVKGYAPGWNNGMSPYQAFPQMPDEQYPGYPYQESFQKRYGRGPSSEKSNVPDVSTTEPPSAFASSGEGSGTWPRTEGAERPNVEDDGTKILSGRSLDTSTKGSATMRDSNKGVANAWHLHHDGIQQETSTWPSNEQNRNAGYSNTDSPESSTYNGYAYGRPGDTNQPSYALQSSQQMQWYPPEEYYGYPYGQSYEYGTITVEHTTPATPTKEVSKDVSSTEGSSQPANANADTSGSETKVKSTETETSTESSTNADIGTSDSGIEATRAESTAAGSSIESLHEERGSPIDKADEILNDDTSSDTTVKDSKAESPIVKDSKDGMVVNQTVSDSSGKKSNRYKATRDRLKQRISFLLSLLRAILNGKPRELFI